jgi:LacI family transcriptional regulator
MARRSGDPGGSVVRIGDVARAAGVSVATVSKALNDRPDVGARTRERVRAIADELGFEPDARARLLSTGRSFSVGLLTTDVYGRFSLPLLLGAEDALGSDDLAVIFSDTRGDPRREARQLRILMARHVDGIIVNGRRIEQRPPLTGSPGVPVVYALTGSTDPGDCSVLADETGGTDLALAHLLQDGRRRIAHITGPRRHTSAIVRAEAARAHLRAHGLSVRGRVRFGAWSEAWGRQATADLLRSAPDIDAVFCGNDQIARGVLDILRELGRQVPGDVAVIGFDNWSVMTEDARPALTSVDLDLEGIGRVAAGHLITSVEGGQPPLRTVVAPSLVLRGSA